MKSADSPKRVLLKDIADATGYTVNTVSRALQNKPDIAKNTCAGIQRVAAEMGYVRNSIASSLRSGRTRTLAVIVAGTSNPFYAIMIDSIHDIAEAGGYTVLVLCSRDQEAQERRAIVTAIGRRVDGVLLFPGEHAGDNIALLRQSDLPFVLVSRHLKDSDYDYVVCDDEEGGYLAGKHLIGAGHRKIAFCYDYKVPFSGELRIQGLLRAAREAGVPEKDVLLYHRRSDAETVRQMQSWKAEGVTAVFAFCDIEAWHLAALLEASGMAGAFALMGFDNIQGVIGFPSPLCTVDDAMRDMARAAFTILIDRIHGDDSPPKAMVFPVRLVCRGSCGAPAKRT